MLVSDTGSLTAVQLPCRLHGRCHNLKMAGSQWSYRRKVQQDALGKVNRVKEIRRSSGADKGMQRANFQQRFFWSDFFCIVSIIV